MSRLAFLCVGEWTQAWFSSTIAGKQVMVRDISLPWSLGPSLPEYLIPHHSGVLSWVHTSAHLPHWFLLNGLRAMIRQFLLLYYCSKSDSRLSSFHKLLISLIPAISLLSCKRILFNPQVFLDVSLQFCKILMNTRQGSGAYILHVHLAMWTCGLQGLRSSQTDLAFSQNINNTV